MIPRDENLLLVRETRQPVYLLLYLLDRARIREIAGVDEHVAGWDRRRVGVCVGYADNPH